MPRSSTRRCGASSAKCGRPDRPLAKPAAFREVNRSCAGEQRLVQFLRHYLRIAIDAAYAFGDDDGWALASHIALSALLALFPFLIVLTALAGFVGSKEIADNLANVLLVTFPSEVADPLAREIHNVLTTARGGVLTVGVLLAVYFSTSGVDSLRIALNRAYNVHD